MSNRAASADVNAGVTANVDAAVAASRGLRLMGFAAREVASSPAAATFEIVNGATGAGGSLLIPVELAANGSTFQWLNGGGVAALDGLSVNHIAGEFDVVLFYLTD